MPELRTRSPEPLTVEGVWVPVMLSIAFRTSPTVSVLISGLGTNATLAHFALPSMGGESEFFAGHIIDFTAPKSEVTSQWVGGSSDPLVPPPPGGQGGVPQAPEPSALVMAAIGLCGFAFLGYSRRRRER